MECCNMHDFLALDAGHGHHRGPTAAAAAAHKTMKITRRPLYTAYPPWFDTKVFYVRVTNFLQLPADKDDDSSTPTPTPDHLTVAYFPLSADAVVRINGSWRTSDSDSDSGSCCVSTQLRRDRADMGSEEAATTYINTDNVRVSGTIGFEVCDGDDLLLSGVLEMESVEEEGEGGKGQEKRWGLRCQSHMTSTAAATSAAARGGKGRRLGIEKHRGGVRVTPTVDVYVAGSFEGQPLILTDTLHLFSSPRSNHNKVGMLTLDTIPEYQSTEKKKMKNDTVLDALHQPPDHVDHNKHNGLSSGYYGPNSTYHLYNAADYMETAADNGELSWFNAGVRVGVGISLGLCVGVGLGVGLLLTSYQATARNLRRRFF